MPLHGLFHDFGIAPEGIEKVDLVKADHNWKPGFRTKIALTREDAIQMDKDDTAIWQVYMDGSGKDGWIGAAAVLYHNGRKVQSVCYRLGCTSEHTVPEAEGLAIVLGLELLRREKGVQSVLRGGPSSGRQPRRLPRCNTCGTYSSANGRWCIVDSLRYH